MQGFMSKSVRLAITTAHLMNRRGADSGRDRGAFRFGRPLVLAAILNIVCSTAWAETSVRVFAIRGFVGVVFSRGMNTLCDELARIEGVDCTVEDFYDLSAITSKAAAAVAAGQHLVLVGHSAGGNAALNIAAAMTEKVPLIVTVDPSLLWTTLVPETADIVINYYQNVDVLGRATLQASPGFRGELQNILRYEPHVVIDGAPEIHAEIIKRVKNMLSAGAASSLPVPLPPVRPRRR
jgi:pimeloyl-ACP methyl ester carboxylesterase